MAKPLALIIEDQPNLAMLYEDALRLVGYDIFAISDGLKALNHLATHEAPDLVILDVNLPNMSGRDIHQHIRKNDKFKDTPVIILTANSLMLDQIRPDLKINDHLHVKPIGMKELQDLAKSLRRDADSQRKQQTETQVVPQLDEDHGEKADEGETKTNPPEIPTPDQTVTEIKSESKVELVDSKAETQEHEVVVTTDDETIPSKEDKDPEAT